MNFIKKWIAPVAIAASMTSVTGTAKADDGATINHCWGQLAAHLGTNGIMGTHSNAHSPFTPDPGDGGRTGVGNVSKNFHDNSGNDGTGQALANGAQGHHAINNGALLGQNAFLANPFLVIVFGVDGTEPEFQIDPLECTSSGNSNNGPD